MAGSSKPFADGFSEPFQPDEDSWTAEIGGNALECHIVKDSLTIRMGKDEPFPVGQADTGTASFEIIGDPMTTQNHTLGWNDEGGAFLGQWTDSGWLRTHRSATDMEWGPPTPAPATPNLRGKTFAPHAWFNLSAHAGRQATITVGIGTTPPFPIGFSTNNEPLGTIAYEYRYVYSVTSGKPWAQGTTGVIPDTVGPWHDGANPFQSFTSDPFTVPANGWAVVQLQYRIKNELSAVPLYISQAWGGGLSVSLNVQVPDTFEAGEKVVIKRNGTTVWTGWVTDEERSWSQSTGSVSKVNAAGPRRFYQSAVYAPAPADYSQTLGTDKFYKFPPGGVEGYELSEFVAALRTILPEVTLTTFDTAGWTTTDGGPGLLPIRQVWYSKGSSELPKPLWLLDGAANITGSSVWESRAGGLDVRGRKYYAGRASDPTQYDRDRVTLNCDDIEAPVGLRKDASMRYTRWAHTRGPLPIGWTPNDSQAGSLSIGSFTMKDDAGIAKYGPLDFNVEPMLTSGSSSPPLDLWNNVHLKVAQGADIEQVDQWTIRKWMVDDALWQKLLTMSLGWPLRITNLPAGMMRDGRTQFDGYLWGWQMQGTDTITLTAVDERVFK